MTTQPAHRITLNEGASRYDIHVGDELVGFAAYERSGSTVTFTHTVIEPRWEGRGLGTALADHAIRATREAGDTVDAQCSFIRRFVEQHPAA